VSEPTREPFKLVNLRVRDLSSAIVGLREWADKIERGEVDCDTMVLVLGSIGSPMVVCSFGLHASSLEIQGWLTRAQAHMNAITSGGRDPG